MLGFVAVLLRQKELHHLEPMSTDFNISEVFVRDILPQL